MNIIDLIYKNYEANTEKRRSHIGASEIGEDCTRKIWYSFRWVKKINHSGRLLKLFRRGHREEEVVIKDLISAGFIVHEKDPDTGKQFNFTEHGHFSGSCDGIGIGFLKNEEKCLLEFKTSNTKSYRIIQRDGVKKAKPMHYDQMQIYMYYFNLKKALYLVVCKENDEMYQEFVELDEKIALELIKKVESIIDAGHPPQRHYNSKDTFHCRFCDYKDVCWDSVPPDVNCRTCVHVTPLKTMKGEWSCEKGNNTIDFEACDQHLYIPGLIESELVDANKKENWIKYKAFQNGGDEGMSSFDLRDHIGKT